MGGVVTHLQPKHKNTVLLPLLINMTHDSIFKCIQIGHERGDEEVEHDDACGIQSIEMVHT